MGEVAWQFFVTPCYSNAQCLYSQRSQQCSQRFHQKQTKVAHVPFAIGRIRVLKKQTTANISVVDRKAGIFDQYTVLCIETWTQFG